jgi:hypothetical protein
MDTGLIYDIDELINKEIEELTQELQDEGMKPSKENIKKKKLERETTYNGSFLKSMASSKLTKYIQDTNQYKVLDTQIKLISDNILRYKGTDVFEQNSARLKTLVTLKNEFTGSIKYSTISQERKKAVAKAESSKEIIKLKKELTDLRKELKKFQPNSLYKLLVAYRRRLGLIFDKQQLDNMVYDFDEDTYTIIDDAIDSGLDKEQVDVKSKYIELIQYLAEIMDESILTIEGMSSGAILTKLKNVANGEIFKQKTSSIENEILDKEVEIKMTLSEIAGDKVTKIIFDNFDLTDDKDLNKASEMLASSRASYVLAIANVLAKKYRAEKYIDDIVGFGLLGLSLALDKWKTFQKMSNIPINFDLFLGINLTGPMVKGIYELNRTGGTINSSVAIHNDTMRKRDIDNFVLDNPDLKNLPYDQIVSVYNYMIYEQHGGKKTNYGYDNPNISTETDFRNTLGGMVDDDTAEMFNNMLRDESAEEAIDEKFAYRDIINSIKQFFTMYKKSIDKKTGEWKVTNKLYFDKWDLKILELSMNMIPNPYKNGSNWDQESIAKELSKLRIQEDGGTFTQGSISIRINDFTKKLRDIGKHYPRMKTAVDFFLAYFASNRSQDMMSKNSGMSEVMKQIYSNVTAMDTITDVK